MVNQNTDTIASMLPPDVFNRLSNFEQRILGYVLQRPEAKFKVWQKVGFEASRVRGRFKECPAVGMVIGIRYQSLKRCFDDGDSCIGWHYYVEDEYGDVEIFYENNLRAVEEAQP